VVEKSDVSFVRRRESRLVGLTASGVGADGCEPPGGQDAFDDECRLALVLATAATGLRVTLLVKTEGSAVCALADRPA